MNKDYEHMTLSELEALKKKQLITELSSYEEAKNMKTSGPPTIVPSMPLSKGEDNRMAKYFRKYVGDNYVPYAMTDSDDGCSLDPTNWSPDQNFAAAIWNSVMNKTHLLGACNVAYNISAGHGNLVDIRCINDFGAPAVVGSCECISCSSLALSTYTVTLSQLGLGSVVCNYDAHDIGYDIYRKVVEGLSRSYSKYFDDEIFDALNEAAAEEIVLDGAMSLTPSLASAGCCEDLSLYYLYGALIEAIFDMRNADYEPDALIISPIVASVLLRLGVPSAQPFASSIVSIGKDGQVSTFAGVKVLIFSGAEDGIEESSATIAILLDSSRACGVGFGMQPTLKTEDNVSCNSTDFYMWSYFGCSALDIGAIRHIVTAA